MISHYIGVINAINGKIYSGEKPEDHKNIDKALNNKDSIVILGEIVFDGRIAELEKNDYGRKYHKLALQIAEQAKDNKRFEILTNELGYSLFKENSHDIEPNIKKFYRYY